MCVSAEQENRPTTASGTSTTFCKTEVLDFSSMSEDEDPGGLRSKAKCPNAGEKFGPTTGSAANINLSDLLMKHMISGIEKRSESSDDCQSDTDSNSLNLEKVKGAKIAKRQAGWFLSSDSEEEKNEAPTRSPYRSSAKKDCDNISMEDTKDVEILYHCYNKAQEQDTESINQKQSSPGWALQRCTEEVQSFDSSEDETPEKRVKFRKSLRRPLSKKNSAKKSVQFIGLKCPSMHLKKPQIIEGTSTGTLDTLLGTVFYNAFNGLQ